MRSVVVGDVAVEEGRSQPDPMLYFFSALATMCLKVFSAFSVNVAACRSVIPNGFEGSTAHGDAVSDITDEADGDMGGVALLSLGELGRLDQCVLEKLALDVLLVVLEMMEDVSLFSDARLECLLSDLVKFVALLKRDRAGEVVIDGVGELGVCARGGDGKDGIWISFRTTMSERWRHLRASRDETYSSAEVS